MYIIKYRKVTVMNIVNARTLDINKLSEFWNEYAQSEIVIKKFSPETFSRLFLEEYTGVKKVALAIVKDDRIIAFAAGSHKAGLDVGYITYVLVDKELRRLGIGKAMAKAVEDELKQVADTELKKYEAVFYNPVGLSWIVPGTDGHDHPGIPGVDMLQGGYIFMKNIGYRDFAYQNSYYRCLEGFEFSEKIKAKMEKAKEHGLSITYYDKNRHYDLEELFDNLKNPGWKAAIMNNEAKENPLPLLVAEDASAGDGRAKVIGFTGPLTVQESGRGYFAGIGVHTDYRTYGLGSALFSSLCSGLHDMGAEFMTLFTGETNPARNIYESAGFKVVRCWADMRKEIR